MQANSKLHFCGWHLSDNVL